MQPVDYLFLFTPNNSGSTVMCQYLAAQTGGYLPPFGNNEGQMAPAVSAMMRTRPWNPDSRFDWGAIHAAWDGLARRAGRGLFIEGSPPNLLRIDAIRAEFGALARCACAISHPYLHVASSVYNYNSPGAMGLKGLAAQWIAKARAIAAALDADPTLPLLRYEDFCADPARLNAAFGLPVTGATAIPGKRNTADTAIRDATARTVAFLRAPEIDRLRAALAPGADLLARFGYGLDEGVACLDRLRAEAELFAEGRARRRRWIEQGGHARP